MLSLHIPDHYVHKTRLLEQLATYVLPLSQHILLITSPTAWKLTQARIVPCLNDAGIRYTLFIMDGECTQACMEMLAERVRAEGITAVVGVGGGRVMDLAKGAGHFAQGMPVINVPTLAATCAAWSPISIHYTAEGGQRGPIKLSRLPVWVLVDTTLLAAAPVRYLKAGIVDGLAKWYEFAPYQRKGDASLGMLLKENAARLARDTFFEYGEQAVHDNRAQRITPALISVIDASIALAGLANSIVDEIDRIGVAHAVHNSVTYHASAHQYLHGEKVGFGLFIQALLDSSQPEENLRLVSLLQRYDMPLRLTDFAMQDPETEWRQVAERISLGSDICARLPYAISTAHINDAFQRSLDPQAAIAAWQVACTS